MNVTIEFKGLKEVIANMNDLAKTQVPFAAAKALTKTAQDVKEEIVKQMPSFIDRPARWTLNGLYIKPATKEKLIAEVGYKDKTSIKVTTTNKGQGTPAAYYMEPNVEGGKRNIKGFEKALQYHGVLPKGMYIAPGEACPLDAYGNIPHGLIMQILSYFKASERGSGSKSNITPEKKAKLLKGTKKTRGFEYILSRGKGEMNIPTESGGLRTIQQHLPAGIYKKEGYAWGSRIRPIMMFVKEPSYKKRFPFHEIARKTMNEMLLPRFDEAMKEALLTMKRTG